MLPGKWNSSPILPHNLFFFFYLLLLFLILPLLLHQYHHQIHSPSWFFPSSVVVFFILFHLSPLLLLLLYLLLLLLLLFLISFFFFLAVVYPFNFASWGKIRDIADETDAEVWKVTSEAEDIKSVCYNNEDEMATRREQQSLNNIWCDFFVQHYES